MKKVILYTLCLSFVSHSALALLPIYAMHKRQRGKNITFQVYNRHSGRTVWKRRFHTSYPVESEVTWVADHRALEITVKPGVRGGYVDGTNGPYSIVIWRAGEKVQVYPHQFTTDDWAFFIWSPDDASLLMGVGGSGMSDEGICSLCCLYSPIGSERMIETPIAGAVIIASLKWYGNHHAVYRKLTFLQDKHGHYYSTESKTLYSHYCP